ncbi:MAG TPA: iron-containing alcohol dehydrogenase, partial [Opitutaceae bacterium]
MDLALPSRIRFGPGTLPDVVPAAQALGRHALVVTGRDSSRAARLLEFLTRASLAVTVCPIAHEPTTDDLPRAVAVARAAGCDLVIGFGGGAALDTAKAVAALLVNDGDLFDYLEVVGRAQPLSRPALPCIAIPTTAGTGSEVTRNAVLASLAHRVKVSLRSPHMLPRLALVDPELTHSLPPALTAETGLDALTQLIEPWLSAKANPFTDALCVEALPRAARALPRVVENGSDSAARSDMALASLYGGLALANAGLGAVHGFAGPIGGMFSAPHGAVCAALLPHALTVNLHALRARAPRHPALARFDQLGRLLTGSPHAGADDALRWTRDLIATLRIPRLSTYGIAASDTPALVAAAQNASSMKANPLPLTGEEL